MRRIGIIVILFFSAATMAYAQENRHFYLLAGAQFGIPTHATADLGIMFPIKENGYRGNEYYWGWGFLGEGGLGHGGARYSTGAWATVEFVRMDLRVIMNHTFASPIRATPGSKYVGFEAGLAMFDYFRVSGGAEHRVSGPSGPQGTIFTVGCGVEIPLPLFKIR
jgi:hypothetical protein